MSSKLTRLETILTAIIDRVEKEPKETEKLYKLMKYYLPTTVKLIKTYSDFDNVLSPDSDMVNSKTVFLRIPHLMRTPMRHY